MQARLNIYSVSGASVVLELCGRHQAAAAAAKG